MSNPDKALDTQLRNIQSKTGKPLEALFAHLRASGLSRHGELRSLLMRDFELGYGDANTVAHLHLKAETAPAATGAAGDPVDEMYAGPKAELRPAHDALMTAIGAFGPFEIAPKKAYVSLRRKKQFATVGPGTKTRLDLGLNMKGVTPTARLVALPPGGMCQYKVALMRATDVDGELIGWIRQAYDAAG